MENLWWAGYLFAFSLMLKFLAASTSAFFFLYQILVQRLKVPPSINQFSQALDRNQATELLKVLMKYQPEDKKAKQQRLREIAAAKEAGKEPAPSKAPKVRDGDGMNGQFFFQCQIQRGT